MVLKISLDQCQKKKNLVWTSMFNRKPDTELVYLKITKTGEKGKLNTFPVF